MLNILITQKWFSLSLYLCGIVLYLSVVVSCFFIHFAHSSTRKECIFIVFINHAHDIGSLIFRLTFSYAMLAIDQTSPKTKLIRIVCERHSRFGNLSHIFFCCSLSLCLSELRSENACCLIFCSIVGSMWKQNAVAWKGKVISCCSLKPDILYVLNVLFFATFFMRYLTGKTGEAGETKPREKDNKRNQL